MITLELFCGTKSFSKVAQELGHKTFTVDNNLELAPDLCIDIMDFKIEMLPEEFRHPDIVWASPPCTTFSVASIRHYWENGKPKNEKALHGIAMVEKTKDIINELMLNNCKMYFFIENPRGMLRKQEVLKYWHKITVTYCQYGLPIMKPTDIWNNLPGWEGKSCKAGASCHQRAQRGAKAGVQGIYNQYYGRNRHALARGIIPSALFKEIFDNINRM